MKWKKKNDICKENYSNKYNAHKTDIYKLLNSSQLNEGDKVC